MSIRQTTPKLKTSGLAMTTANDVCRPPGAGTCDHQSYTAMGIAASLLWAFINTALITQRHKVANGA